MNGEPMRCAGLTPILNVSNLPESFRWFERLGWKKLWDWGEPPGFGAVGSGACEIFLCQDGQGGRGKSDLPVTTGQPGADAADRGVWMSLWVDDVDRVHGICVAEGIEVTHPPTDEPWGVREMHVRHPDGHVFRVGRGVDPVEEEREPLKVARVERSVRLEARLAHVLDRLAQTRGVPLGPVLEEIVLHSFEPYGGGVADPYGPETHELISRLKKECGLDYETHATRRFVEVPSDGSHPAPGGPAAPGPSTPDSADARPSVE